MTCIDRPQRIERCHHPIEHRDPNAGRPRCGLCKEDLPQLDLNGVQFATHYAKRTTSKIIDSVRRFKLDADREARLKVLECPHCYYFRSSRIAGQAFTNWACAYCGTPASHPNTGVPRVCAKCAEALKVCTCCTGDLEMKKRTVLVPGERKRRNGGARAAAHQGAAEALLAAHPTRQCSSVFATRSGATFCIKRAGHDGDHRGSGKQWNAAGERVKITEKMP